MILESWQLWKRTHPMDWYDVIWLMLSTQLLHPKLRWGTRPNGPKGSKGPKDKCGSWLQGSSLFPENPNANLAMMLENRCYISITILKNWGNNLLMSNGLLTSWSAQKLDIGYCSRPSQIMAENWKPYPVQHQLWQDHQKWQKQQSILQSVLRQQL